MAAPDIVYRPGRGLISAGGKAKKGAKACPPKDGSADGNARASSSTPPKRVPGTTQEEPGTASPTSAASAPAGTSAVGRERLLPELSSEAALLAKFIEKAERKRLLNAEHQRAWRARQKLAE